MEDWLGRPFKFKAWDLQFKVMREWKSLKEIFYMTPIKEKGREEWPSTEKVQNHFDNLIPLQFTGLEDQHGNELWEGDIVKMQRVVVDITTPRTGTIYGVITYVGSGFYVSNNDGLIESLDMKSHAWERLGDCFQNPELLNKTLELDDE